MAIDLTNGKTFYADSVYSATYATANAGDESISTRWSSSESAYPHWLAVDLVAAKVVTSLAFHPYSENGTSQIKDFKLQGSNDTTNGADGTWVDLLSTQAPNVNMFERFGVTNSAGYRWYRFYVSTSWMGSTNCCSFLKVELFDADLHYLVPFMTANNAPSPYVVSTDFTPYSTFYAWKCLKATINNENNCCAKAGTSGIIMIDLGEDNLQILKAYRLWAQWNSGNKRAPKNWTLQASNDNSNWDTLDTKTNVTDWSFYIAKPYAVANSTAYRYYRLNCTANNGDATYYSVNEFSLFGAATPANPPTVSRRRFVQIM